MDYYSILGVDQSASQDQIKRAYRNLVKQHHPDQGGDADRFKKINEAYETLKDPDRRAQYDNPKPHFDFNSTNFNSSSFEDLFETLFRQQRRQMRNRDIRIRANIDIKDCFTGKTLEVRYTLGSGEQSTVTIEIPPGVNTGDTIQFQGLGDNTVTQLPRGNLLVTVNVENSTEWRRENNNLFINKTVNVLDLITGCAIVIETLEGKNVSLTIPKGTRPETVFSMKSYGLPNINSASRGNLYIKIKADVPKISDANIIDQIESIKQQIGIKE